MRNHPLTEGTNSSPVMFRVSTMTDPLAKTRKSLDEGPLRDGCTAPPVSPKRVTVTTIGDAVGFVRMRIGSKPFPLMKCGATRTEAG